MAKFYYEHPDLEREGIIWIGKPGYITPLPRPEPEPEEDLVITGACEWCGGPLISPKQRKYCSDDCRYAAESERGKQRRRQALEGVTYTCGHCGKAFPAVLGRPKYCSKACYQAINRHRSQQRRKGRGEPIAPRPCVWCGNDFTPRAWNQKACSPECYAAYHRKCSNARYQRMRGASND